MVRISTNPNELGVGETGTTSPGITWARGSYMQGVPGAAEVTRGVPVIKWAMTMKRQKIA